MANEEAKAMLDALMGADRNAPLPKGAAVPTKLRHNNKRDRSGGLVLPGKRHKSCYDKDIDPLSTAWGIDVYELFVNTKSDLGANPYIVDEGAKEEFRKLPVHEQERLGFHYHLFQKLSELVRQCDRTVNRNKEKLRQELNRKLSQRGGQDFVEDVDDSAVEMLAHLMIQLEDMTVDLNQKITELDDIVKQEDDLKKKLEPLLEKVRNVLNNDVVSEKINPADATTDFNGDKETLKDESLSSEAQEKTFIKNEEVTGCKLNETDNFDLDRIQLELGTLTLRKQRVLFDIGRLMAQIAPLQDSVETQRRQLNYVRSDISTDKTVCEVSGNFMSARDADERIAAHYAGKQYVGWKLVRDKLSSMIKKYGAYGPPRPGSGGGPPEKNSGNGPSPRSQTASVGGGIGSDGGRRPIGNFGGNGGGYRGGGNSGPPNRNGPPERGRWERNGGPPQQYPDRGPRGQPQRDWRR